MKNLLLFLFIIDLVPVKLAAQQTKDSCCITKEQLTGTWQRNDSIVGDGLDQHFQFFKDGSFIVNLGNDAEDLRTIIQLKGKYRLNGNRLYFTITSKTMVDGSIGIADAGISLGIFEIENGKLKEVKEANPREIPDPCFITFLSTTHIKINNETYYKLKQ